MRVKFDITQRLTLLWSVLFLVTLALFAAFAATFVERSAQSALDQRLLAQALPYTRLRRPTPSPPPMPSRERTPPPRRVRNTTPRPPTTTNPRADRTPTRFRKAPATPPRVRRRTNVRAKKRPTRTRALSRTRASVRAERTKGRCSSTCTALSSFVALRSSAVSSAATARSSAELVGMSRR